MITERKKMNEVCTYIITLILLKEINRDLQVING